MSSPKSRPKSSSRARVRRRTRQLRQTISNMDYLASGTLHIRTKQCGRKNCRCAENPEARHGPYHEWSRREDGRLLHSVVTPKQAELLTAALDNYREILEILELWQRLTAQEILETADSRDRASPWKRSR
jgi:hypothetical protein